MNQASSALWPTEDRRALIQQLGTSHLLERLDELLVPQARAISLPWQALQEKEVSAHTSSDDADHGGYDLVYLEVGIAHVERAQGVTFSASVLKQRWEYAQEAGV